MRLQDFDFRIWDKHHKGCGNKDCKCQTKYVYGEEAKIRLSEFKEDCEIELFTGLYDKNGNKIYEGDILRIQLDYNKVEKGFVQYHNGIFKVINRKAFPASHEYCVTFLGTCYIKDCVEIIGNIHENAELLK
ncbi:YopX family protein [Campylobacter jejuni]|uniref:YopX family protein n=1 Tax=Campylobacter sp. US12a TaxID=2498116 RepID=UPI0010677450|nr:YopX family protein [Campylobacter sp. US12a]TEY04112.1 hypothetical protein ELQ15_08595 [Campylobacter sp. US12a]